jgi:hypothetical protein|mmetsp:Transcript_24096/g.38213  ORF Transcript_24096/g.38213 Transcript_24096/m.38213 type:complete len:108 (-) Transcript_24096:2600-2923(-)
MKLYLHAGLLFTSKKKTKNKCRTPITSVATNHQLLLGNCQKQLVNHQPLSALQPVLKVALGENQRKKRKHQSLKTALSQHRYSGKLFKIWYDESSLTLLGITTQEGG